MRIKRSILNDTGSRKISIDNTSSEGCYIDIRTYYQQISYHESNGFDWLSTCLLIGLQDSQLDQYLLKKYKINCNIYKCLRIHEKGGKGCKNRDAYLKNEITCYLDVCIVTQPNE